MHEQNVKALLKCKGNINLTCTEFYENIKSNVVLLKKMLDTEKYYHYFVDKRNSVFLLHCI